MSDREIRSRRKRIPSLWGSNIGVWLDLVFRVTGGSCSDPILAGEPVKDRSAVDLVVGEIDRVWWLGVGLGRYELFECSMWPRSVEMVQVDSEDPA